MVFPLMWEKNLIPFLVVSCLLCAIYVQYLLISILENVPNKIVIGYIKAFDCRRALIMCLHTIVDIDDLSLVCPSCLTSVFHKILDQRIRTLHIKSKRTT